jgi:hypothetical protein
MKHSLLIVLLFMALAPTALASTTWYVDGVHGSNHNNCRTPQNACKTIRHAISLASSGDSIRVAPATYTENLTIRFRLKVIGADPSTTVIDGGAVNTVVTISSKAHVTLARFTIQNGSAPHGGGVNNAGTLTVTDSTISGNRAFITGCDGDCVVEGGGIYNTGTLSVIGSTIGSNSTSIECFIQCHKGELGGGIFNIGTLLKVNDSTISGNLVNTVYPHGAGGGIWSSGVLTINNSTISTNAAGDGGGIYNYQEVEASLQNSIVANSPSGGNCSGTITSNGYNLSSDNTCNFNSTGDLNNTDPMLGPLQNNGGPTQTQALLSGSPAIDAGNPSGCTDGNGNLLKTDQRGRPRPDKEDTGGCDMGAFERQRD